MGDARNPYRALAAGLRVVDALDQVEPEGSAVRGLANAGGPPPLGHACVVASGVVDHGDGLDRKWRTGAQDKSPASTHAGLLARPHIGVAVGTSRLDAVVFLERELEQH